jgi:hypothetical protein
MVTILPVSIDEDLIRDGLSAAVADRLERRLRDLTELVTELRTSGIVRREQWQRYVSTFSETAQAMEPVMEYARCFEDQWPADGEADDA